MTVLNFFSRTLQPATNPGDARKALGLAVRLCVEAGVLHVDHQFHIAPELGGKLRIKIAPFSEFRADRAMWPEDIGLPSEELEAA